MSIEHIDTFVWPAEFACTMIDGDLILPNHYNIKFYIEPLTDRVDHIGLGFKKIRYLVNNCFHNSVMVHQDNPLVPALKQSSSNLVLLPTDPYDFGVGSTLYNKFVQVTEKYFDIYQFTIDSLIGDRIQYTMRDPSDAHVDLTGDHWWNQDNATTNSGDLVTWEQLNLNETPRFEPKIVRGGLSEH